MHAFSCKHSACGCANVDFAGITCAATIWNAVLQKQKFTLQWWTDHSFSTPSQLCKSELSTIWMSHHVFSQWQGWQKSNLSTVTNSSSKWALCRNSQTGSASASDVAQNCWEWKERGDCSVPLFFSLTLMHYLPFYLSSICFAVLTYINFFMLQYFVRNDVNYL